MNDIRKRIKRYKELKADIVAINVKMSELEDDMLGVTGLGLEERTGKTYKITSSVEQQAEKHINSKEKLIKQKLLKEREILKIDNAMSILKDEERDIIETVLIEQKKYVLLEIKYNRSYARIKQIEKVAITKMEKYLA